MTFTETNTRLLVEMLTWMRPAGSKTERRFIREYIRPLGVTQDAAGNLIKRIGSLDDAPILWSCHTDTVHRLGGNQVVEVSKGIARLGITKGKSNCLGADCSTGVWLMREMILANVPGLYIFHRGEECGGVGSTYIARKTPELLAGTQYAVAFDRKGYKSIITHQGTRCCSDAFAWSLASALDARGMEYELDQGGTFTDTACYTDLIPECSNISVGYSNQHSAAETQDLNFALQLKGALCSLDIGKLECERIPGSGVEDWGDWGAPSSHWGPVGDIKPNRERYDTGQYAEGYGQGFDDKRTMMDLVQDHPDIMADLLCEVGYDIDSLRNEIWVRGGML